jgi:hypothetical protein
MSTRSIVQINEFDGTRPEGQIRRCTRRIRKGRRGGGRERGRGRRKPFAENSNVSAYNGRT